MHLKQNAGRTRQKPETLSLHRFTPRFRLWGTVAFGFTGVTKALPRFTSCRHKITRYCRITRYYLRYLPTKTATNDKWHQIKCCKESLVSLLSTHTDYRFSSCTSLKGFMKSPCRQGAFEKPKRIDIKCQTRLLSFISPLHSRQNDVPKHLYNILQSCHIIAGQWHLSETSPSPVCSNLTFGCSAPCCSALMPNLR